MTLHRSHHFLKWFPHEGCGAHVFLHVHMYALAQALRNFWSQPHATLLYSALHKTVSCHWFGAAIPHQPFLNSTFIRSFSLSKHSAAFYLLQHQVYRPLHGPWFTLFIIYSQIHTLKLAIVTWLAHGSYTEGTWIFCTNYNSFILPLFCVVHSYFMCNRLVPWLDCKCIEFRRHACTFCIILAPTLVLLALVFVQKRHVYQLI